MFARFINRSGFLGSSVGLGALAIPQSAFAQATPAATPSPSGAVPPRKRFSQFFADDAMNFVLLNMLSQSAFGMGDVGTTLAIFDRIEDGNDASAFNALTTAGYRARANADAARAAGHHVSARDLYFQAANYIYTALYFCDGMGAPEKMLPIFRDSRGATDNAFALLGYPVEHIRIPYEGTTMPGYFIKPDASNVKRPLCVMVNGSDGSINDMWAQGGKSAIERGYNVLIFDGPGQGAMLWLQKTAFRYDFEAVVTPVVNYALKRHDVDPKRLVLQGISQGGYWVPRALAFEHRFAAAVADPGAVDIARTFWASLPAPLLSMLNNGQKTQFDQALQKMPPKAAAGLAFRARPYGFASYYDFWQSVKKYTMTGIADRITTPLLITDPDNEQFFPGQPKQLYDMVTKAKKALVPFTVAEGADRHCEPGAPALRSQKIYDWLDTQIKPGHP
jgi:dienelactone hydrolase